MVIEGQFKTVGNKSMITVSLTAVQPVDIQYVIGGDDDADIYFSDDPVHITAEDQDLETAIISKRCTISLKARPWLGSLLFSAVPKTVSVLVQETDALGTRILFQGYVEPAAYNQDYSQKWNDIDINCIDLLGELEYEYYIDDNYNLAMMMAELGTFKSNIIDMFPNNNVFFVYNDGNVAYVHNLDKKFNENCLLGESEDEHRTQEEVLNDILLYFGCKIVQDRDNIYIFDPMQFKVDGSKRLYNLKTGGTTAYNVNTGNADYLDGYIGGQYDITVDDIYNKICIECDREDTDEILDDLIDNDKNTFVYPARDYYMREYSSDGIGDSACDGFRDMVIHESTTLYEAGWYRDHYFHLLENPSWEFYVKTDSEHNHVNVKDLDHISQLDYMGLAKQLTGMPLLCRMGYEDKINNNNKSVGTKMTENDYVLFSINGQVGDNLQLPTYDDLHDDLGKMNCIKQEDVNFTPPEPGTTYYIVFNGKIRYDSLMETTWLGRGSYITSRYHTTFKDLKDHINDTYSWSTTNNTNNGWGQSTVNSISQYAIYGCCVPFPDDTSSSYYTQKFMLVNDGSINCMAPPRDDQRYQKFSGARLLERNDNDHTYEKFSVLECSLRIGDKYLKETFEIKGDKYVSKFEWVDEPAVFTLGFNPKQDDKLIGNDFEFSNNITAAMNIDGQGTAIPMTFEDGIKGDVEFKVLGLVDYVFNPFGRMYRTIGGPTQAMAGETHVFPALSALWIKEFDVKVVSDMGGRQTLNTKDLVYMSDAQDGYVRNQLDVTFPIISALTEQEAFDMNVDNKIYVNTVYNADDTPCMNITGYDGQTRRAEKDWIVKYYDWLTAPRDLYKITIKDEKGMADYSNMPYFLTKPLFTTYDGDIHNVRMSVMKTMEYDVKNGYFTFEGYI